MRFWHIVKDAEGTIKEQYLVSNDQSRLSLECNAQILNGTYEIIAQIYE